MQKRYGWKDVLPLAVLIVGLAAYFMLGLWPLYRARTGSSDSVRPEIQMPAHAIPGAPTHGILRSFTPRSVSVPLNVPEACRKVQDALREGASFDMIRLLSIERTDCLQPDIDLLLVTYVGAQDPQVRSAAIVGLESQAGEQCRAKQKKERGQCQRSPDAVEAYGNCIRQIYAQPDYICVSDYFERLGLTAVRQEQQARELTPHCNLGLQGEWDKGRAEVNAEVAHETSGNPAARERAEHVQAEVANLSVVLCGESLRDIDPSFAPWQALGLPDQAAFVDKYIIPWLNAVELEERLNHEIGPNPGREQLATAWGLVRSEGIWVPASAPVPSSTH